MWRSDASQSVAVKLTLMAIKNNKIPARGLHLGLGDWREEKARAPSNQYDWSIEQTIDEIRGEQASASTMGEASQ